MEFYTFSQRNGRKITSFDSDFIMARIVQTDQPMNISCMHLDEDGVIGYHQAKTPQLLLILNGEGSVRNNEEVYVKVQPGDAVFWKKNEWHETKTVKGLTAIVIEGKELDPSSFMALKNKAK